MYRLSFTAPLSVISLLQRLKERTLCSFTALKVQSAIVIAVQWTFHLILSLLQDLNFVQMWEQHVQLCVSEVAVTEVQLGKPFRVF